MSVLNRCARHARRIARVLVATGPVGLFYVARLALRRRRMRQLESLIERENELHRESRRLLNRQLNDAIANYQADNAAAALYWRQLGAPEGAQP